VQWNKPEDWLDFTLESVSLTFPLPDRFFECTSGAGKVGFPDPRLAFASSCAAAPAA